VVLHLRLSRVGGTELPVEEGGDSGSAWLGKDLVDPARREERRAEQLELQSSLAWPAVRGRTVQEKRGREGPHTPDRMKAWEEGTLAAGM
jgi:hypothetical protein